MARKRKPEWCSDRYFWEEQQGIRSFNPSQWERSIQADLKPLATANQT
ncbi:MAG: hypothetical protein WCA35_18280 [Kovacikia sp.]